MKLEITLTNPILNDQNDTFSSDENPYQRPKNLNTLEIPINRLREIKDIKEDDLFVDMHKKRTKKKILLSMNAKLSSRNRFRKSSIHKAASPEPIYYDIHKSVTPDPKIISKSLLNKSEIFNHKSLQNPQTDLA